MSHLVLASKFSLPPTVYFVRGTYASYELGAEASVIISNALDEVRLLSGKWSVYEQVQSCLYGQLVAI